VIVSVNKLYFIQIRRQNGEIMIMRLIARQRH